MQWPVEMSSYRKTLSNFTLAKVWSLPVPSAAKNSSRYCWSCRRILTLTEAQRKICSNNQLCLPFRSKRPTQPSTGIHQQLQLVEAAQQTILLQSRLHISYSHLLYSHISITNRESFSLSCVTLISLGGLCDGDVQIDHTA